MATSTPESVIDDKPKSRRPKDTKFKQQRLPAWQPILTAGTVLPAFFAIGIAFIPLGVALLLTSNNVKEITVDYTNCKSSTLNITCGEFLEKPENTGKTCSCIVVVELKEKLKAPVYMYYGLTNFFQNHRRYVRSRDDRQLKGDIISLKDLSSDCEPFRLTPNDSAGYAPCGAIANSLFNDTFNIFFFNGSQTNISVGLIKTGIAWQSDKSVKFRNPPKKEWNNSKYTHPPYWQKSVWQLDTTDESNTGYQNEDLIVWMRTAALPTFRKLHRRINHTLSFENGLPSGKYYVHVNYSYPVTSFNGAKRIILTTTSWLGGKNPFLGIAYLVVGCICILLGIVLFVIHLKWGKRSQDIISVTTRTNY